MAKSKAATVEAYLAELPESRRVVVSTVREMVKRHLPKGYVEHMNWGMISYEVPKERFPNTFNNQPLSYVSLAAQKNHYALYLMCVYCNAKQEALLRDAFKSAGKKLDMGKSCLRFKKIDDIPLEAIGRIIGGVSVEAYIAGYEKSRAGVSKR